MALDFESSVLNKQGNILFLDLSRHNNNAVKEISVTEDLGMKWMKFDDKFFLYKCQQCPFEIALKYSSEMDRTVCRWLAKNQYCPTCFALTFTAIMDPDVIKLTGQFEQPYLNIFHAYYCIPEQKPHILRILKLMERL